MGRPVALRTFSSARGVQTRAVGLVVRRLVDDADAELDRQLRERLADAHVEVVGLDDARTRDEKRAAVSREPESHTCLTLENRRAADVSHAPVPHPQSRRTTGAGASAAT